MLQAGYDLDEQRRRIVLENLNEVCLHRAWTLLGAHVRNNHVHVVVEAPGVRPERVMNVKGGVNLDHFGGAKVDQLVKG